MVVLWCCLFAVRWPVAWWGQHPSSRSLGRARGGATRASPLCPVTGARLNPLSRGPRACQGRCPPCRWATRPSNETQQHSHWPRPFTKPSRASPRSRPDMDPRPPSLLSLGVIVHPTLPSQHHNTASSATTRSHDWVAEGRPRRARPCRHGAMAVNLLGSSSRSRRQAPRPEPGNTQYTPYGPSGERRLPPAGPHLPQKVERNETREADLPRRAACPVDPSLFGRSASGG